MPRRRKITIRASELECFETLVRELQQRPEFAGFDPSSLHVWAYERYEPKLKDADAILRRKLAVVSSRYAATQSEWERHAAIAVSSLYGIDILADNVTLCRNHLYDTFLTAYWALFPKTMKLDCCRAVRYLLATNILWGDALILQTPDESARPIVFAEWSDIGGGRFKRRDFTLANLLQSQPMEGPNLFSDLGDAAFIPTPVAEYPLVHFLKLGADEEL